MEQRLNHDTRWQDTTCQADVSCVKAVPDIKAVPDGMETIGVIGQVLDSQGLALCLFDAEDRTLLWNRTFLRFFPEHDGHVHVGEPYARNLERFYAARLTGPERDRLSEFVAAGIARHRAQTRPFSFEHRGRRLLVSSLPLPQGGGRVRVWKALAEALPGSETRVPVDPFAHLADGAMVQDRQGRITDANQEFVELYGLPSKEVAIGRSFREVLQLLWEGHAGAALDAFLDNARFAGAAFEVELPGDRWRRVIERRMEDGTSYVSHADITTLKRQQRELQEAYERIAIMAITDGLTGIANRGHFEAVLEEEARRGGRSQQPLSLLLIDIDHFKQINDRFGHPVGDACLRMVARHIDGSIRRPGDLAARFGGEEFAAILPGTDAEGARVVAEAIRLAIESDHAHDFNADEPVTVSVGAASLTPAPGGAEDAIRLIREADDALYRAKRAGRNRVILAA